jgi:ion channel POLLUX/CASTOR
MAIQRGLRAKVRYRMDEFIGGGAGKQLLFLAGLTVALVLGFTLVGLVLGVGAPEGGFIDRTYETAWFYFGRVVDSGTFTADEGMLNRGISTTASILGVIVAGLLISALAGNFQERLESIRRNGAPVMEDRHFVVLGWSDKIYSVIDQLSEAYAAEGRITVAVMAEGDKVMMEERLYDNVQYGKRVKIVVRSGSSVSLGDLEKVSFAYARAIVVLVDERDVGNPDQADARVMKTLMAIFNHPEARGRQKQMRVTAEVMQSHNQELAIIASSGFAKVVKTNEMISKVILQTARISGLSLVYDELLRFEGNEIHFKSFPQLVGRRFGEVLLDFPNGLVVGVAKSDGSGHVLNPPADHVIAQDEELLILAEDSNITWRQYPGPLHPSQIPPIQSNARKNVEHMLVLGWNPKIFPIMKEFDDYVAEGSTLTLVNSLTVEDRDAAIADACGALGTVNLRHLVGQFTSRALMDELQPQNYPLVMVLGDGIDGKSAEEADTRAIIALLLLRDARRRSSLAPNQRVVSEILDPKNRELAATTQINDIVISNEMVSMVLAQVTYEPRVQAVLEDLLRSEGSEIYLKPLSFYCPDGQAVTFEYLILAAKARGEVALGLQIISEDAEKKYGLTLNPTVRNVAFVTKPGDRLVVLAEEDG